MLGRTATHSAWVEGRAVSQQAAGFKKWRFVGPADERARDDHVAILGKVFEYGTEQSDLALQLLHEPNCRHRQVAFFDDPELDTPEEDFEEQKRKAGLYWDEEARAWKFWNNSIQKVSKTEKAAQKKAHQFAKTLIDVEVAGLNAYTNKKNGKAYQWNELLRKGESIPAEDAKTVRRLSDILQRAPKFSGTTYRGLGFDTVAERDTFLSDLIPDDIHRMKAFTSSSISLSIAEDFAQKNGVMIIFKSKKGVYLNGLSVSPEESEVLFDRNTRFRVLSRKSSKGYIIVEMSDL